VRAKKELKFGSRNIEQLRAVLDEQPHMSIRYDLFGNMAFIYYEENKTS